MGGSKAQLFTASCHAAEQHTLQPTRKLRDIATQRRLFFHTMDPRVARLKSPAECESFGQNARERGAPNLADQARKRAVQLRTESHGATSEVERECLAAVYAYEEVLSANKGKRQPATRTWQMIHRYGIIPAVERIVTKRAESIGYTALVEMDLFDLAFEAVVLRHPECFSVEAIARSRKRLENYNSVPPSIEP